MSYDCDYEIKDMPTFLIINETIKKDIQSMLSTLNLDLLPKPNKTQVEIQYLMYDNGIEDLDYYHLYILIHNEWGIFTADTSYAYQMVPYNAVYRINPAATATVSAGIE